MRTIVVISVLLFDSSAVGQQPKEIANSIGMKFVLVLPGSFTMGSPKEEKGSKGWETQHQVAISNWYYLGACEVTQDEYEKLTGKRPRADRGRQTSFGQVRERFRGAKYPVNQIS